MTTKRQFKEINKKEICSRIDKNMKYYNSDPDCEPIWYEDYGGHTEILHGISKIQLRYLAYIVSVLTDKPISSLFDIETDEQACEILDNAIPDLKWFKKQLEYDYNLDHALYQAFNSYSYEGDGFINSYLRNSLDIEIPDEFPESSSDSGILNFGFLIEKYLKEEDLCSKGRSAVSEYGGFQKYIERRPENEYELPEYINKSYWKISAFKRAFDLAIESFNQAILDAPPTPKDIVVYRGIKSTEHLKKEGTIDIKGFLSTSLDYMIALKFAKQGHGNRNRAIIAIKVPAGTPCILMTPWNPNESEILFPLDAKLQLEDYLSIDTIDIESLYHECDSVPDINLSVLLAKLTF